MPVFQVELSDGRAFEIEADAAPSEADVLKALGAGGGTKPEKIGDAVESVPTAQLRAAAPVPVYQRAYRAVRETLSPLLGPTQEQMARDSIEWGGQRLYKPLGSEVDRSGFFPALSKPSVELPKFDTSQSEGLLPSAGKAVANTAMGFVDFATSPLGFATMAVGGPIAGTAGKAGKAIHRGVAGAFGADMLVKSPEAIVQAIDTARDPNATLGQKFEAGVGAGVNLALGGYLGAKGAGFPRARVNAEARGIERELGETPGNTGGTPAPLQLPERTGPIITPPPQPTFDKLRTTLGTVEEQLREAALLRDEGDFTTEARSARSPEGTQRREDAKAQVERAGRELVTPAEAPALTPVAESGVPGLRDSVVNPDPAQTFPAPPADALGQPGSMPGVAGAGSTSSSVGLRDSVVDQFPPTTQSEVSVAGEAAARRAESTTEARRARSQEGQGISDENAPSLWPSKPNHFQTDGVSKEIAGKVKHPTLPQGYGQRSWTMEKGRTQAEWFAVHPDGRHAIAIYQADRGQPYAAEILTHQTRAGLKSWEPLGGGREFSGTVEQVIQEIQRRNDYINQKEGAGKEATQRREEAKAQGTEPAALKQEVARAADPMAQQKSGFDPKAAKAQKKFLLDEIDKAIAEAPEQRAAVEADAEKAALESARAMNPGETRAQFLDRVDALTRRLAAKYDLKWPSGNTVLTAQEVALLKLAGRPTTRTSEGGMGRIDSAILDQAEKITIEVPGDGTFSIVNSRQALKDFKERAAKFPTTAPRAPKQGPGSPRVNPSAPAPLGKLDAKGAEAAAELMAGQDATRPSIQHLWSDGKQTVATDGRAIIVVDKGIGGTEKQPVMVKDGKAKKVKPGRMSSKESEDSYPNWRMVIPNEESLVTAAKGLDTGRLFTLVRQAQEATSEKQISVKLFRNPDGSIGVEAMAEDVGSYSGNVQEGAKVIGSYNPQYLLNILNAMRKVGSEKVDLRVTLEGGTEMNPIVIQGHGAKAVLMPMRMTDTRMGPDAGIPEGALTREDFEGGKVSREGAKGAKEPDIVSKLEAMKQAAGGETMATVIPGLDPATFRAMRNTALDVAIGAIKAGLAIREAAEAGWQNLKAALDKLGLKYDAAQLRAEFVQALTESDARVGLSARGTGILGDESLSAEMRSGVNPAYARRPQEEDAAFARRIVQSIGGPEAAAREWLAGNFRTEPEAVQTLLGIETQRQLANTERAARSRGDVAAADGIVTLQQALAEADMQRATDLGQGVAAFRMHYANWTPAAWVKDFREKVAGLAAERVDRARVEGRGSSVEGKTEATPTGIAQGVAEGVADKIEAEGNPKLAKTIREHWGKRPVGDTVERVPTTLEERLAKVGTKNPKATARKVQGFYEKEVRDWRRKHKIPEFDAETEREIIREANRIEQLPEDSIQRREAAIRLHDRIARMKGFEWWELPLDFWYANILSGFTTHARNILGNSVNLGAESALMMARNPSAIPQIIEALGRALPKSAREAGNVLRTGRDTAGREHASKFDAPGVLERVSNPVASKLLLPWKLVGRTLRAEDLAAFYPLQEARAAVLARHAAAKDGVPIWKRSQVARRILGWTAEAQARAVAKARGEGLAPGTLLFKRRVSELLENQRPEVLMRNAREFAFDGTFNNDPYGLIGAVADGIKNASVREPALKFVVPFTRIVANVSNSMLNWTPVGFWRAGRAKGYKLLLGKEANTGKLFGREVTDPQAIGDEFTRATVGTAALLGVAAAAAASIYDRDPKFAVTGGGPSDPDQKALLRQTGWIPYSVKVGDRYVSYQNTTAGLGLGIIGAYMDAVRYRNLDEQDALNRAAFALGSGFNVVLNSSFLSGLASLFNQASETGTKHPVKGVPATAIRTATSLAVPNFVKQVDQLFDPTRYSADDVRGMMLGQIPFARRNGQPDLNVFGEPVLSPLSKTFWSETQGDLLTRTLAGRRLWPSVPAESGLTADEHYEVMRLRGPLLRAALAERLGEITSLPRADAQAVVSQVSAEQTRAAMQALGLDSVAKVRREVQRGVRK